MAPGTYDVRITVFDAPVSASSEAMIIGRITVLAP